MKMGRRRRCSVTYRFRYAPSSRPAAAGPAAHFDRNESHAIYATDTGSLKKSLADLSAIQAQASSSSSSSSGMTTMSVLALKSINPA
jgi:hypothetical protein